MPYKSEKIKLPEKYDRRRKLSSENKEEIKLLYSKGGYSLNGLAKKYGVSKKTILLIVNAKSAKKDRQYRKEHWREWQKKGEEWNAAQREHRSYKQKLYISGVLNEEDDQ